MFAVDLLVMCWSNALPIIVTLCLFLSARLSNQRTTTGMSLAQAANAAQELLHQAVVMEALSTLLLLGVDANAKAGLAKGTQALFDYLDSDGLAAQYVLFLVFLVLFLVLLVVFLVFLVFLVVVLILYAQHLHFA